MWGDNTASSILASSRPKSRAPMQSPYQMKKVSLERELPSWWWRGLESRSVDLVESEGTGGTVESIHFVPRLTDCELWRKGRSIPGRRPMSSRRSPMQAATHDFLIHSVAS